MIPTIVVLRIEGHGTEHLSLHAKREQAHDRLSRVGRDAWLERFSYDLPGTAGGSADAGYVSDRLVREGWRVRLTEEPVEL